MKSLTRECGMSSRAEPQEHSKQRKGKRMRIQKRKQRWGHSDTKGDLKV